MHTSHLPTSSLPLTYAPNIVTASTMREGLTSIKPMAALKLGAKYKPIFFTKNSDSSIFG